MYAEVPGVREKAASFAQPARVAEARLTKLSERGLDLGNRGSPERLQLRREDRDAGLLEYPAERAGGFLVTDRPALREVCPPQGSKRCELLRVLPWVRHGAPEPDLGRTEVAREMLEYRQWLA